MNVYSLHKLVLAGITSLVLAACGLAAGTADPQEQTWCPSATGGDQAAVLSGHAGAVWSVAWSPDGRMLVSGSGDRTVRLWSVEGAAPMILPGRLKSVNSVAWSPDGRTLASGSFDCTMRLWRWDGRSATFSVR